MSYTELLENDSLEPAKSIDFGPNSAIRSLSFTDEPRHDHGAPCRIKIEAGSMLTGGALGEFCRKVEAVVNRLNLSDDADPSNHGEHSDPNTAPLATNRHTIAGNGTGTLYIDRISPEHVRNVMAKALRLMVDENILSGEQMVDAYRAMSLSPRINRAAANPQAKAL